MMKTGNNILIATLALLMISCLSETTFQPNFPTPTGYYVPHQAIDFFYKLDRQNEGVVYFENQSVWMEDFQWDFGEVDLNGNPSQSNQVDPVHTYRSNGSFTVSLTAVDTLGYRHQIEKVLDIDNCGN